MVSDDCDGLVSTLFLAEADGHLRNREIKSPSLALKLQIKMVDNVIKSYSHRIVARNSDGFQPSLMTNDLLQSLNEKLRILVIT